MTAKPKKKKKNNKKKAARDRAQTAHHKSNNNTNKTPNKKNKNKKGTKRSKSKGPSSSNNTKSTNDNKIELNTISHSPPQPKQEEKQEPKKKRFPWANWTIDRTEDTEDSKDEGPGHRQRRSSLGSVREFHIERVKRARIKAVVAPPNNKTVIIKDDELEKINKPKESKKKKKKKGNKDRVDIYDPKAMKKQRRKEKKQSKYKVIPKHHVKRSSLPTYNSIRKNNPKLTFYVKKETQRNLATLLDQPEKRAKSKRLKNLSRTGFDLHVNHRYRLEDGRIGVCKFKGRTAFGKSSEDWIGLVIQVGEGEHDGTVQGKTYFRCRDGKGLFVRPYDIIQDMGSQNKILTKNEIKLAKEHIKRYKKMKGGGTTTSKDVLDKDAIAINPDHGYDMMNEKFYNPKTLLDKNKGKKAAKKKHHTQV